MSSSPPRCYLSTIDTYYMWDTILRHDFGEPELEAEGYV